MSASNYFRHVSANALIVLVSGSILFGAEQNSVSFRSAKGGTPAQAVITSPEQINAIPHPISTNKPMRKNHKPPMVPPADKVALLVKESYDPANPHHILDRSATAGAKSAESFSPCQSFIGITNTGWNPPDPHLAVGPNHVVEVVNSSIAIFDKNTGTRLLQSTAGFWFQSTNPPAPSGFIYDPKVVYDPVAGHFIILYLCTDDVTQASYLVSVSQTSNAMGIWYSYNFDATLDGSFPTGNWADYPGLGFDYSDAVYVTSNQWEFGASGPYQYVKIRILPKSELYIGDPVSFSDIWDVRYHDNSTVFTIKPATSYSDANGEFLLSNIWYGANYTTYWKITDPLGISGGPVITRKPRVNLVSSYPAPPNAQQLGGSAVGTIGPMTQEVTYRNGKVYTTFDQAFNWGSGNVSAVRLLGIDTATSTATFDKVFGADMKYYYFPSIYVDPANRVYAVFDRSAGDEYIGVYYVEDILNDPSSKQLKLGEGTHGGSEPVRWGDYSGISGDGGDQNKVWFCNEYSPPSSGSWRTWIGEAPSKVGQPTLASPANDSIVKTPVSLTWDVSAPAPSYHLQIDDDTGFASPEVDTALNTNTCVANALSDQTVYRWRVQGIASCPDNAWSIPRSFKICNSLSGDADGNGLVNITDAIFLVSYVFGGGPAPSPLYTGDPNCDLVDNVSDAVYLIAYIFSGGPAPCSGC